MPAPLELAIGARRLVLREGSLTDLGEHVDALVSSDDNYLTHGGGVSAALWEQAGPALEDHCASHPGLRLGDVFATPAFDLDATWLLHAVTIDFDANRRLGPRDALELFGAVLDRAAELGCKSVAVPLLGSGAGRLTPAAAALAAAEALDERAAIETSVERVLVVALGSSSFRAAHETFTSRLTERPPLGDLVPLAAGNAGRQGKRLLAAWETLRDPNRREFALPQLLESALAALVTVGVRQLNETGRNLSTGSAVAASETLQLTQGFVEPSQPLERMPMGQLAAAATELFQLAGEPLSDEFQHALATALTARNQLAHSPPETASEHARLQRSIAHAVELVVTRLAGGASVRLRARLPEPDTATRAITTAPPPADASAPGAVQRRAESASGTAHVRRLCQFLQERLDAETLEELYRELDHRGYRGPQEMRLLEHCVRMDDPVAFVASEFTPKQLRTAIEKETGLVARNGAQTPELAGQLLEAFGFPSANRPLGLPTVLQSLQRYRVQADGASLLELKGSVTEASGKLEYLVQVLLRFVCQAAFRESPDAHFRRQGKLNPSHSLDRCSLGTLLDLLEHLSRELERAGPQAAEFRRDFDTQRLSPPGTGSIASLRNKFAHFDRDADRMSMTEARRAAQDFFGEAIEFLTYLGNPETRVFPHIIRIERIQIDRWGRRTIEAVSDEGSPERVFTDKTLQPGQIYFMHPLTNPLRVDPILVPAGEVEVRGGPAT